MECISMVAIPNIDRQLKWIKQIPYSVPWVQSARFVKIKTELL